SRKLIAGLVQFLGGLFELRRRFLEALLGLVRAQGLLACLFLVLLTFRNDSLDVRFHHELADANDSQSRENRHDQKYSKHVRFLTGFSVSISLDGPPKPVNWHVAVKTAPSRTRLRAAGNKSR